MAIYHNEISVCSGKKGQSAVASIAYQTAEKVYCEAEGLYKDYTRKENVLDKGIIKPDHAPEWCLDREKLWNEVEKVEGVDGRYARKHNLALPKELNFEQQKELVEKYCKQLAEQGMVCDYAIHNNREGTNPHCHIMTTTRPFLEDGSWGQKSKNVTVKDKDGKPIIEGTYKNGRKKYKHKCIKTTNWDDKKTLEQWREDWEVLTNQALERAGSKEKVSAKSFKRQGKAELPTQHLGYQANELEKKGIKTDRGNWNREAKEFNKELNQLIAETAELEKVVQKAEVIYYEKSREQLKPSLGQTQNRSRNRQRSRTSLLHSTPKLFMQNLQISYLGQDQNLQRQDKAHNQSDLSRDAGSNLARWSELGQDRQNRKQISRARNNRRLFPVPAHQHRGLKGAKLGAVTICALGSLSSTEKQAVGKKVTPFLKSVFKNQREYYNEAGKNLDNLVFAKSKNGNLFLLDIRKDNAIKKGFLGKVGEPKKMPAKSITKGVKACGGELFRAGKDSAKKLLSAMQEKTRKEHHKQARQNIKDTFKTPLKAIGEIFSNPITGILKLPARALEMIGNVVAAGVELAGAAGKKENEKTPSALKNAVQPRVRSLTEDRKNNDSNLI